jgi:hypothetical protein
MDINTKIAEITACLTWPIVYEQGDRDLEITCDPWSRTHTIRMPTAGADWRDIEYLHELAHATLAERHHLLETAYFARGWDRQDLEALTNPVRVASDWFADDLLMQWVPEAESAEILEHAGYGRQYAADAEADPMTKYGLGLAMAQAVKYLGESLRDVPSVYRPVVDILLATDPSKPSIEAKRKLINQLAALTCRYRVHLAKEDGVDVWRIKK